MDPTPVDQCVCRGVSFAELVRIQRETGAGFDEIQERTGCGTSCGVCVPYIRIALATGRVRLPVMNRFELREATKGLE